MYHTNFVEVYFEGEKTLNDKIRPTLIHGVGHKGNDLSIPESKQFNFTLDATQIELTVDGDEDLGGTYYEDELLLKTKSKEYIENSVREEINKLLIKEEKNELTSSRKDFQELTQSLVEDFIIDTYKIHSVYSNFNEYGQLGVTVNAPLVSTRNNGSNSTNTTYNRKFKINLDDTKVELDGIEYVLTGKKNNNEELIEENLNAIKEENN